MTCVLTRHKTTPGALLRGVVMALGLGLMAGRAETVFLHLHNGDRLSGDLIHLGSTNVVITNAVFGRMSVPLQAVDRIIRPEPPSKEPAAPEGEAAPVKSEPAPEPLAPPPVAAATSPPAPPPAAPVEAKPKPKPPKRWTLDAQFGTDLQINQRQIELFYGRAKWTYGRDRFRGTVDYLANYGEIDGTVSANNMVGSTRVEVDITRNKRGFAFNALGAGYDEIRKLDLYLNEGFGVGYKVITRTNFVLNADIGLNYERQWLSDNTRKEYAGLRLGDQVSWSINSKWKVDQKFDYFPRFSGLEDLQTRLELNIRYLLLSNLTLNLTLIDLYDTQPAPGVSRNDFTLRGTVGVRF